MAQIILDSANDLIQGDFDSATVNNRTKLQTSTTNAATGVYVVPNGSATAASVQISNAANPTNASKLVVATNGSTDTQIISGINGTGTYLPLSFYTNNDIRFQMNNSGALGVRTGAGTVGFGTSGQVLTSGGSGASPTWSSVGLVPTFYYQLNSAVVGANATGAQNIFGVGATLSASTIYELEIMFMLVKTAGTTSHNVSIGFGGTATLNNIGYFATGSDGNNAINTRAQGTDGAFISSITASSIQASGAKTSANVTVSYIIKGTVSINAGGTFIPQYTLSAAPGGAYTTQNGSYVKLTPLGASGANINIGSWA